MALITCPECGRQVSDAAQTCPTCGYPIAQKADNKIMIRIDRTPQANTAAIVYNAKTNTKIGQASPGGVIVFESDKPVDIYFAEIGKMLRTTVYPGKKYLATWHVGMFGGQRIESCIEVDAMNF